jgi:hypothetical protein
VANPRQADYCHSAGDVRRCLGIIDSVGMPLTLLSFGVPRDGAYLWAFMV